MKRTIWELCAVLIFLCSCSKWSLDDKFDELSVNDYSCFKTITIERHVDGQTYAVAYKGNEFIIRYKCFSDKISRLVNLIGDEDISLSNVDLEYVSSAIKNFNKMHINRLEVDSSGNLVLSLWGPNHTTFHFLRLSSGTVLQEFQAKKVGAKNYKHYKNDWYLYKEGEN